MHSDKMNVHNVSGCVGHQVFIEGSALGIVAKCFLVKLASLVFAWFEVDPAI